MNNTIKPKGFVCYLNNYVLLKHLSDSEAGQLWKMLYRFALTGEQGEGDTEMVNMLFESFSAKLEEDFAQYAKRVENSRKSGIKSGIARRKKEPKRTNVNDRSISFNETNQYKDKDKDKDKDKYKDKDKSKEKSKEKASAGADAVSADDVLTLYHSICKSLPKVSALTENDVRMICLSPEVDFREYFTRVERSDFLTGRSGRWKGCTLQWLLRPDTVAKVMNGYYDDRPKDNGTSYDLRELDKIDPLEWIH